MDSVNIEEEIQPPTSLYSSVKFFQQKFLEKNKDNYIINGFSVVDRIEGDFITDYTKDANYKEGGNERKDINKFTICWVVEVPIVHQLGIADSRYYYVVYRANWFNRWANIYYPSAKKYHNQDGITLKVDIITNSLSCFNKSNISKISTLVFVTQPSLIYYISMEDVLQLSDKKLGIFTDKWNQVCVGIPKSSFSLDDPTKFS